MKKSILLIINSTFVMATLFACSNDQEVNSGSEKKSDTLVAKEITEKPPVTLQPVDSLYNNLTQLIGGRYNQVKVANAWDDSFVKRYCSKVDEKYEKIRTSRLKKMGDWNFENLKRNNQSDTSFVFYPFSGGDFIHLNWMYPNATEYLMVAQEDVGTVPDLGKKDSKFVNQYLNDVDTVLRDIYYKSYFITKNMNTDTKVRTLVNGMLPLLLWAVSRTDHEVLSLRFANVNSKGQLEFLEGNESSKKKAEAVQITIRKPGSEINKTLTYVSCNISDDGFKEQPKILTFLKNTVHENCNSFVKSASYLLHYGSFEKIRNLIKEKSQFLVQDDTGIPFRHFTREGGWKVELFGKYEKPVKDFSSNLFQPDLDSAYRTETYYKGPIDFSLGYHWGSKNQNQMVIKKAK